MWGLRRQVSLLLSEGHTEAPFYPLHRVWEEVSLVEARVNAGFATQAVLTQAAVASVMAKEGQKYFDELVRSITHEQA